MRKNIIYYFSGTGNCLAVAKTIAAQISNCEIISMSSYDHYNLEHEYESIGFIYPVYFQGLPLKVENFVSKLNLPDNEKTFYYAIVTYGAMPGITIAQLARLLKNKNVILDYGAKLKMFSNYIVAYDMGKNVAEKTLRSEKDLIPIIQDIQNKKTSKIKKVNPVLDFYYHLWAKKIPELDKNFVVSQTCISCGVCKKICPVQNIQLHDGKPEFNHHCEQCMACIQFCPEKAINFKNWTQKRRRYNHPHIRYEDMI